jgi:hypothetical protein
LAQDQDLVGKGGFDVVVNALEKFFHFPHNTFLHNFTVSALRLYIEMDGPMPYLLAQSHFEVRTKEVLGQESYEMFVFWGQLRQICQMLEDFVDKEEFSDWNVLVSERTSVVQAIIGDFPILPVMPKKQNLVWTRTWFIWLCAVLCVIILYATSIW